MDLDDISRLYDFSRSSAVVTGGIGILGSKIATVLANCGANVAIIDIKTEVSTELHDKFDAAPGKQR